MHFRPDITIFTTAYIPVVKHWLEREKQPENASLHCLVLYRKFVYCIVLSYLSSILFLTLFVCFHVLVNTEMRTQYLPAHYPMS